MEFVILIISAICAGLMHFAIRHDTVSALAFGAGLVVFALIPLVAALFGGAR